MDELNEQEWGTRINEKHYSIFDLDAPDWVKEDPALSWYSEGLVVWDKTEKTVVTLNMWQAMDILDQLEKEDAWKTAGHDVYQKYFSFSIPIGRKSRKKVQEAKPPSKSEEVTIHLHLSPERVTKFLAYLKRNERYIRGEGMMIKARYEGGMQMLARLLIRDELAQQQEKEKQPKSDPYNFSI
jgi:hypothetical protein